MAAKRPQPNPAPELALPAADGQYAEMADEPENLVLVQLREMRTDAAAFRKEVAARFDAIDARFEVTDGRIENIDRRLALTEAAQNEMLQILKEMAASVTVIGKAQQVTGARLNTMDQRLALIEEHIGFVKA